MCTRPFDTIRSTFAFPLIIGFIVIHTSLISLCHLGLAVRDWEFRLSGALLILLALTRIDWDSGCVSGVRVGRFGVTYLVLKLVEHGWSSKTERILTLVSIFNFPLYGWLFIAIYKDNVTIVLLIDFLSISHF